MTDPTGLCFLSYKRKPAARDARLLVGALRVHGVPTWQDIDDLDEKPTEEELRRILRDPSTASALLWITPTVGESAYIVRVEAPEIVSRARAEDGFFVVPCAAGGLSYDEAAAEVRSSFSLEDLRAWNMRQVAAPLTQAGAAKVAEYVLRRRLKAIHRYLEEGQPLRVSVDTRSQPAKGTGLALHIDWSMDFCHRTATPATWNDVLLPALGRIVSLIRRHAPGRKVEAEGQCALPAALALGLKQANGGEARAGSLRDATRATSVRDHRAPPPSPRFGFSCRPACTSVCRTAAAVSRRPGRGPGAVT